jgi:hypothetical protein
VNIAKARQSGKKKDRPADCLEAALQYAAMGFQVFPCIANTKEPATPHGFKDATTDVEVIKSWWKRWPDANVAIATAGLLVIDGDPGCETWRNQHDFGRVPKSATPRGGRHYFYRRPKGKPWKCSAGKLAKGVDVRTNGGYVVLPPSRVKGGDIDGGYSWLRELRRRDELPLPPSWLTAELDRLYSPAGRDNPERNGHAPDLNCKLEEGERNDRLYRLACSLRGKGFAQASIEAGLLAENRTRCAPPLPDKEVRGIAKSAGKHAPGKEKKASQATRLVGYAKQALELFHTPDGEEFATTIEAPRQTWPLGSKAAKDYLSRLFYVQENDSPGSDAIGTALATLRGIAKHDGEALPVFTRIAEQGGRYFLDLGDATWRAVKIGPRGWKVIDNPPVRFRRSRGMLALPEPVKGGTLDELRPFLNVDERDWPLVIAWMLQALRPCGPYPTLCLGGEQGTAKSTTARVLRELIDPNTAPLRSEPRNPHDLIIAATNSWVVAFDNLSHLQPWLSDCFCRLSTGGGFSTRELYTNADEILFDAKRPVLLNGIEDLATRGDLLERSLILTLPVIPEEKRRTEARFWSRFNKAKARILGALLDAICAGLKNRPNVKLERLPRMADFAKWIVSCEPGLGWEPHTFLDAYQSNARSANDLVLESSPVTRHLRSVLEDKGKWENTTSELLGALENKASDAEKQLKSWPKTPRGLSGILRRLAPNLRRDGIDIDFPDNPTGGRGRVILIRPKRVGAHRSNRSDRSGHTDSSGKARAEPLR